MGLTPCCLALYPAVAGTCCAGATFDGSRFAFRSGAAFLAGTASTTTALGMLSARAGHAVIALSGWPRYGLALIPLAMGLHLLGWARVPIPAAAASWRRGGGIAAAFGAGLLLSVVVGPCGTPVLASIFAYAAYQGEPAFGSALLFLFGVGSALPVLLAGTGAGEMARRAASAGWRKWTERGAGALLVGLGFYRIVTVP